MPRGYTRIMQLTPELTALYEFNFLNISLIQVVNSIYILIIYFVKRFIIYIYIYIYDPLISHNMYYIQINNTVLFIYYLL